MTDITAEQRSSRTRTNAAPSPPCDDDTLAKSYRYVRLGMIGLLLGIAAAVTLQSLHQGSILGSVSAYYYTPAQAIFVGGLIGLATCMIALRGQTGAEEILLNLGGMFAFVVAIVPTGRNADYQAAIRACRDADATLLTERAAAGLDCPTVNALAQATRENVANNLSALLLVGVVALLASLYFTSRDRQLTPAYWWGFGLASLLWAVAAIARLTALELVVDRAHVTAAVLLFVCVILVAGVNAYRISDPDIETPNTGKRLGEAATAVVRSRNRYVVYALVTVVVSIVAAIMWWRGVISLFWLEAVIGVLFGAFWVVQTVDYEHSGSATTSGRR